MPFIITLDEFSICTNIKALQNAAKYSDKKASNFAHNINITYYITAFYII